MTTAESRAIRNSQRRAVTAEKKKRRTAEQREIDEKFQTAFTVEQNQALTRTWWGQP